MSAATAPPSVIDPERHHRLLADLDHICQTANIPKSMIERSATEFCGPQEIEWLRRFPEHREASRGLILTGELDPPAETRLMAMTAALLRNFIDARVVTLSTLLDWVDDPDPPSPSVILVPNLHLRQVGRQLPSWKIQNLYDLLLSRLTQSKPLVGYVESMDALTQEYGLTFAQHLRAHYEIIGSGA